MTHICVSKLTINGSDGQRQTIIWTNSGILLIGPLGKIFSEIIIEIDTFSFKKIHLIMSSGKWSFCLGLNILIWLVNNIFLKHYLILISSVLKSIFLRVYILLNSSQADMLRTRMGLFASMSPGVLYPRYFSGTRSFYWNHCMGSLHMAIGPNGFSRACVNPWMVCPRGRTDLHRNLCQK